MILGLSDDAAEFGVVVRRALDGAGGDNLVRRAETEPDFRAKNLEELLGEVGLWELDTADPEQLEAAAAACRSVGWWGVPYPVAERLAGLIVVDERVPTAAVAELENTWAVATLEGRTGTATALPAAQPPRYSGFATALDVTWTGDVAAIDLARALTLPCWTLLGMLDRAIAATVVYVNQRSQFGQPIAKFQNVQFSLTDAEVERAGVEALAAYALWSVQTGRPGAVTDALALRLAAVEAAEVVFRTCHQLHGAMGFCDETQLSWLSRYSQPLRRTPLGPAATRDALRAAAEREGLAGPFSR